MFKKTLGNGYVRLEYACILDQYYLYTSAGIVFFSLLKFIKLLQFNNRMNLLGFTFARCWNDLLVFFFTFAVIFFAFTTVFFTIFTLQLEEFSNYLKSIQMCFSMMLGKFDFRAMARANALSPIIFFVFSLSTSMVLINLMLTIIIRTFSEVKNELFNVENKYDILDYITNKSLIMVGLRSPKRLPMKAKPNVNSNTPAQNNTNIDPSEQLPDKINDLLTYVNNMYFEGQLNLKDQGALKSMFREKSEADRYSGRKPTMTDGRLPHHSTEIFKDE